MMKVLVLLTLATVVLSGSDWEMTNKWQKLKAMESCWGEDNMKLYTVKVKTAVAKCSQEDAPELSLPPYRSSYRFVNAMISGADQMEDRLEDQQKMDFFEKMFNYMKEGHHGSRRHSSYKTYSRDNEDDSFIEKMKFLMNDNSYETNSPMSYGQKSQSSDIMTMFSKYFENNMEKRQDDRRIDPESRKSFLDMFSKTRSKRAAGQDGLADPNLDLGDRLVEKLNQQKHVMEAKVGNMTCVLKEMGCLNFKNEIDIRQMKQDVNQYNMNPWFTERYEEILDTCYAMASNLPAEISENSVITGDNFGTVKMGEIKSFMKCCSKSKTKLCMNQDIKKKVEANFGPLEEILEQTQLTEYQLFPLVIQLLHGQEMEYMVGDF